MPASKIGYSLLDLSSNTEYAWTTSLPWTIFGGVRPDNWTVTFSAVDQVMPDSAAPTHRLVERWQLDSVDDQVPPEDFTQTGTSNGVWNANSGHVECTGIYTELSQAEKDVRDRQAELIIDTDVVDLKDRLQNANVAQIETWLTNNVTDLPSARIVLAKIIKYLASRT